MSLFTMPAPGKQQSTADDRDAWRPSLIVGCPRSGTTLLAVMLGSAPRDRGRPGNAFFQRLRARGVRVEAQRPPDPVGAALSSQRIRDLGLRRDQVEAHLGTSNPGAGELFIALMRAYSASVGKAKWCEKSPGHLFDLQLIRRLVPDVRAICVVRDGRDVALSLQRMPWRRPSIWMNARLWARRQS